MNAKLTENMNIVLANAIVSYQKLHHYHWQVKGHNFFGLHAKFEELYDHWAEVVDNVAERILTVGGQPIGTLKEALAMAKVQESSATPEALAMVNNTLKDLEIQLADIREASGEAEKADDRGTVNLLDSIADNIEKTAWMFKAFLSK